MVGRLVGNESANNFFRQYKQQGSQFEIKHDLSNVNLLVVEKDESVDRRKEKR